MTILLACKGYYPHVPTMGNLDQFQGFVNTDITKALEYIDRILSDYFPHLPFAFQTQSFVREIWVSTRSPDDPWPALAQYYNQPSGPHTLLNLQCPEFQNWDTIVIIVQGVYEALFAAGLPFGPLPTYKRNPLGCLNQAFDSNIVYSPPLVTLAPVPVHEDLQLQRLTAFKSCRYIPEWYFSLVWNIPSPQLEAKRWHELATTMDYLRMVLTARQATMPGSLRVCFHRQFSVAIEILGGAGDDDLFIRPSRLSDFSRTTYERTQLVNGAVSTFLSMSAHPKLLPAALPPTLPEEDEEDA
ncbi:hypothetical protein K439DRAFT_1624578 [Ramaria rubella]|nr:hypothetical protein K439DRAFT_1624578 [Ramaria rubella]